ARRYARNLRQRGVHVLQHLPVSAHHRPQPNWRTVGQAASVDDAVNASDARHRAHHVWRRPARRRTAPIAAVPTNSTIPMMASHSSPLMAKPTMARISQSMSNTITRMSIRGLLAILLAITFSRGSPLPAASVSTTHGLL